MPALRICLLALIALLPLALSAQSSNVAKGKTTRQSSESSGGAAARAVDGNTNNTWGGGSITHTTDENDPWWEVDLGGVHDISEIKIWNRTDDCCWNRLQNFYVMVSESPISANSTTANQYAQGPLSFTSATETNKSLKKNTAGRYVRIFIPGNTKVLSLAEVEVVGTPRPVGHALYFNGTNQHAEFTAPNMPSGSAARTIEFWIKSDGRASGAKDNHESVIELGEQAHNGSAFGIFTQVVQGKTQLAFWGHNADKALCFLPDDQWHFVAITYQEPNIQCYLDGELKATHSIVTAVGGQRLNTKAGKCYIGGFPGRGWYYKGAVANLSIWNGARSAQQIKQDMIPYPCRQSNDANLVAHFKLDGTSGTAFSDLSGKATGKLMNGAAWTKPISADPAPISEGVWFVIQNKSDVDTDVATSPRRMALRSDGVMAAIPLTGNYDDFLWRTVSLGGGKHKLVNKKSGMSKALDSSPTNLFMGNYGNFSGQSWTLTPVNVATMGSNVYTITNDYITSSKALTFANNQVVVAAANKSDTKQAWVLQPMGIAEGYHIPKMDDSNCPTTLMLRATDQVTVYGTNTTSEWAMLNTQLIIKNMMGARLQPCSGLAGNKVYIITRYDYNAEFITKYPLVGIPAAWIADTRGGAHYGNYKLTMVSEEMMCRKGVASLGTSDQTYREFDQVVHEFGHAMGGFNCTPNQDNITAAANCGLGNQPQECFAASVQAWFNNNFSYDIIGRTREELRTRNADFYNYINTMLNVQNTWMPPRTLREAYDPAKG